MIDGMETGFHHARPAPAKADRGTPWNGRKSVNAASSTVKLHPQGVTT